MCGLHWRPLSGTKTGFPTKDGINCPKDVVNERMIKGYYAKLQTSICDESTERKAD